ncbi:MAG TPA: hypothetical protein VF135_01100 [Terriglobales bacterium]
MKKFLTVAAMVLFSVAVLAQEADTKPKVVEVPQETAQINPADVQSIDAIIKALYDVISGPPGPRDWNRFQALFIPEAHLIFSGKRPDGSLAHKAMTPAEYQERSGAFFLKEGFFENSVHNRVDQFGTVAQVFSTYESRHAKGEKPFTRGINSIQLLNDGKRWWVVSILWDSERPDNPIPEKYLK